MAKNPAQYGLDHLAPEPPLKADRVEINYPVDLRLVAECVDTSVATLQELNPSLLRLTTPKDGSFSLALPAGTAVKFQKTIAAIPKDMRVWWRYHKVNRGETLAVVARQYHTTSTAIAQVNNLRDNDLGTDSKLIIPVTPGRRLSSEGEVAYSKRPTSYKVRKGDTVLSIADDFSVPAEKIRKWNHLHGNQVRAGRTLRIYRPVAEPATAPKMASSRTPRLKRISDLQASNKGRLLHHKVKSGETLVSIANRYNTSVAALRRDNKISSLKTGDVLVIRTQ
jgi:membrane-bound lytic murein transglycosylase D